MDNLTRYRPFMTVFCVWFVLACGCVGDPSLLLSTGTEGSQPVAWQRVDYQATSPSRLVRAGLESGSPFTVFVGDESFDFVVEEVYEDDFGVTLDVASGEQAGRFRIAVTDSSSIAFVYALDGNQLVEDENSEPIAYIYRSDEGLFLTLSPLTADQYVMPKATTTTMVLPPVPAAACGSLAVAIAINVIAGGLIVGLVVFTGRNIKIALCDPYDCTTKWKRFINGCA